MAMQGELELSCRCGAVRGRVTRATPHSVNRILCYCDDCQAYVHWLQRADLLNPQGGSDIVQVPPASLRFERGHEHLRALRLSPKGMYRWYASCCNTPVGNTPQPSLPFVGILAQSFVGGPGRLETLVGPARGTFMGKFAVGELPAGPARFPIGVVLRFVTSLLRWRLTGQTWPHPFFERETGSARYPVTVLTPSERDALRPLCGPHPTRTAGDRSGPSRADQRA
jgi:hypothetical protein